VDVVSICYYASQIFEINQNNYGFIIYLRTRLLPLFLLQKHEHMLSSFCLYLQANFQTSISFVVEGTERFTSQSTIFCYDENRESEMVRYKPTWSMQNVKRNSFWMQILSVFESRQRVIIICVGVLVIFCVILTLWPVSAKFITSHLNFRFL
jgi:hypothetical protein